jgi:hypothetical protein
MTPAVSLEAYQDQMRALIDKSAGTARARYITVAPGQEATYQLKKAETERYLAAVALAEPVSSNDYPFIFGEALATGQTTDAVAAVISATAAAWMQKAAQIESARLAGKKAVTEAENHAEASLAATEAREVLEAL